MLSDGTSQYRPNAAAFISIDRHVYNNKIYIIFYLTVMFGHGQIPANCNFYVAFLPGAPSYVASDYIS